MGRQGERWAHEEYQLFSDAPTINSAPECEGVSTEFAAARGKFHHKVYASTPWHFLYFFPLPHGQGSLRPTFSPVLRCAGLLASPPPERLAASSSRCFLRWNSFSSASIVVEGCRVGMAISRGGASCAGSLEALATGGAGGTGRRGSGAAFTGWPSGPRICIRKRNR